MALTVLPVILVDSGSGSAAPGASGAGPATAVAGAAAAHTGGSATTTITFTNSPDLSGVAQDGSHVLFLETASGRRFSRISTVDNSAKTCVVEDTFNIAAGSAVAYAIGGKLATIRDAGYVGLIAASTGAKPGWTIQFASGHAESGAVITIACAGDATTGMIVFKTEDGYATRATFTTSTTSNGGIYVTGAAVELRGVHVIHATSTTSASYTGIYCSGANSVIRDCKVSKSSTGNWAAGIQATSYVTVCQCEVDGVGNTYAGIYCSSYVNKILHNTVKNAPVDGIYFARESCVCFGNVVVDPVGDGIVVVAAADYCCLAHNTVYSPGDDGIVIASGADSILLINNLVRDCDSGVAIPAAAARIGWIIQGNNAYNCTANYSVSDVSATNTEVDPEFVNQAAGDYTTGANCIGTGWPTATLPGLTCRTYLDQGAVQRVGTASGLGLTADVLKNAETVDDVTGTLPILGRATGSATVAKETGEYHGASGSSLKFTPTSESTYGYVDLLIYVTGNAGKLSFYYKSFKDGASSFNGTVKISMWDSDDPTESPPPLLASVDISGTYDETDWYQYQSASKTHAAEGLARIRFEIVDGSDNGGIYIDDIAWTDD